MDFTEIAHAQASDKQLADLCKQNDIKFTEIMLPGCDIPIVCETTAQRLRPYLPEKFRKLTLNQFTI